MVKKMMVTLVRGVLKMITSMMMMVMMMMKMVMMHHSESFTSLVLP